MKAIEVYNGSDGELTKKFYAQMDALGACGQIGTALFRAHKCSARAKVYRGGIRGKGSYRSMAYDRKTWSMKILCELLTKHSKELGITWGWKRDQERQHADWILYVEIHTGQVSFHSTERLQGPDYLKNWCGRRDSAEKILAYCDALFVPESQRSMDLFSMDLQSQS